MAKIEQHVIRIVLSPSGTPLAASATTELDDGGYRTTPVEPGPFDTVGELLTTCVGVLDLQGTLW